MEHRRARADQARLCGRTDGQAARALRRRAASCISARASGIRASSCRAGRCRSTGAPTASRCWHDPALFADEREPGAYTAGRCAPLHHASDEQARRWTRAHIQPGYEDTFYYLWRERRLPVNVDPFDSRARRRTGARASAARVRRRACREVTGYVLPIDARARPADAAAEVGERPVVLPRRPHVPDPRRFADGLPAAAGIAAVGDARATIRTSIAHDPFAPPAPLRSAGGVARMQYGGGTLDGGAVAAHRRDRRESARPATGVAASRQATGAASASAAATAITRQPSRRRVCVVDSPHGAVRRGARPGARGRAEGRSGFVRQRQARCCMSSCRRCTELDDYLDLLAAVEATAADLRMKMIIEGYPPPRDARLKMLQVTPDPGVIEVNIHPARELGRARRPHRVPVPVGA